LALLVHLLLEFIHLVAHEFTRTNQGDHKVEYEPEKNIQYYRPDDVRNHVRKGTRMINKKLLREATEQSISGPP
jgi:hypothetical protein